MPKGLLKYLPDVSDDERKTLFGDITSVLKYPRGDPIREGVILGSSLFPSPLLIRAFLTLSSAAYDDTMKILVIAATVLSVIPILLALIMPDWYLGDKQNAVDDANLAGERVPDSRDDPTNVRGTA